MKPRLLFIPAIHGFQKPGNGGQLRTRGLIEGLTLEFDVDIYSHHHKVGDSKNTIDFADNVCPLWHRTLIQQLNIRVIGRLVKVACRLLFPLSLPNQSSGNNIIRGLITAFLKQKKAREYDLIMFDTLILTPFSIPSEVRKKTWFSLHNIDSTIHKENLFYEWHESNLNKFCNGVIVCTKYDEKIISSRNPNVKTLVWANGCFPPIRLNQNPTKNFDVAFVGSLNYQPNIDGLKFFFSQVVPSLTKPIKILVLGRNPSAEFAEFLKSNHNTTVKANVANIEDWLPQAKASIVPLLEGSGSRLKIAESLILGLPCISTELGAEGYPTSSNGLFITPDNDGIAFARAVDYVLDKDIDNHQIQIDAEQFLWSNTIRATQLLQHLKQEQ